MAMNYVLPTGYLDLDNDCTYNIDLKSTRSRERVDPKTDLAFYFNEYIKPKYGLHNINVGNCASFMKELDMNWTKLDQNARKQVMDILSDGILSPTSAFAKDLQVRLNQSIPLEPSNVGIAQNKSSFGKNKTEGDNTVAMVIVFIAFIVLISRK